MRILVSLDRCHLYAQCCFLAPSVFKLEGEEALTYHPAPEDGLREQVLRAAAACPMHAITVEPEGLEAHP
jgi:ferredoxin